MGARTGKEFLDGLAGRREVWLDGKRVDDVTAAAELGGAARTLAALFDLQFDHPDELLTTDSSTGEQVGVSHVIPRSAADLKRRHTALELVALHTVGQLGRSPDYVNITMAGFAGRCDVWSQNANDEGAAHLVHFQREAMLGDYAMTHAIVNPAVDKAEREIDAGGGNVVLHLVGESAGGYVVRGARALATLAPFADEMVVYPGQPLPGDAADYALSFSIPTSTPGLRFLCRDSLSADGDPFDHPLSSRFDEQDAVVIFDDVVVPRERMFLAGDPEIYNKAMTTGWVANIMQQTTIRAHVKLRFAWELATQMTKAINANTPAVTELLGEMWSYAEITRSIVAAAEAGAHEWGNGVWFCDERPFRAIRPTLPRWFPRANEIIKLLGSHSLLATPTRAELDNPELRPLIELYYQGANGMTAAERTSIFRTAWDLVGSGLAGRGDLYERFYLASSSRMYQVAQAAAEREADFALVNDIIERSSVAGRQP